jgi:hypothetical protein
VISRPAENLVILVVTVVSSSLVVLVPTFSYVTYVNQTIHYFHLYTGFRFIAIVVAPLVAAASSILIARRAAAPPGPLRRAVAIAIVTTVGTPPVVALLVGVRALLPGAVPLVASVPELLAVVAVGGWLYWSPVALALMGPLLLLGAWMLHRYGHALGCGSPT